MRNVEAVALADFINRWDGKYQARTECATPQIVGSRNASRTFIVLDDRQTAEQGTQGGARRRRSSAIPIHHAGEYLSLLEQRRTHQEPSVEELEARLTDWLLD